MASLRHSTLESGLDHSGTPEAGRSAIDDALLDAARAGIVAVGWKRCTLTDVARRAGVSRMTIYRRWSDMETLLADVMTREFSTLVGPPSDVDDPVERLAAGSGVHTARQEQSDADECCRCPGAAASV